MRNSRILYDQLRRNLMNALPPFDDGWATTSIYEKRHEAVEVGHDDDSYYTGSSPTSRSGVSAAKSPAEYLRLNVPQARANDNGNPNNITCLKSSFFHPFVLPAYNNSAATPSDHSTRLNHAGASRGQAPKGASASTRKMVSHMVLVAKQSKAFQI